MRVTDGLSNVRDKYIECQYAFSLRSGGLLLQVVHLPLNACPAASDHLGVLRFARGVAALQLSGPLLCQKS